MTSHFAWFATVFALVFQQTSAVTYCNTVNVPAVRKCYQTYMASFNIRMTDNLPAYSDFSATRAALFQKNGLYENSLNCQFILTLLNCLDSNFECMDSSTYLVLGASNTTDSTEYWTDLLVNQYQCTAEGSKLKNDNYYCYENCRKDHAKEMDACRTALSNNINAGMELCKAFQGNAECQQNVQTLCCGYNTGVLACNSELAGIRASTPTCSAMGKVSCPAAR